MTLDDHPHRRLQVTEEHLVASRRAAPQGRGSLLVDAGSIDALAERSGDTYIWHMVAGSAARESPLLRARMEEAGVGEEARLAHGASGLIFAVQTAYAGDRERPILGVRDVRYLVPVFEGAHLSARIEPLEGESASFDVTTDQLDPNVAITGRLLYGALAGERTGGPFAGGAEGQAFTLEESIGLVSALIGLWVQGSEARVLYMGQSLELQSLAVPGDTLEATADIVDSVPHKRGGERVQVRVTVRKDGSGQVVATGDSLFLRIPLSS